MAWIMTNLKGAESLTKAQAVSYRETTTGDIWLNLSLS